MEDEKRKFEAGQRILEQKIKQVFFIGEIEKIDEVDNSDRILKIPIRMPINVLGYVTVIDKETGSESEAKAIKANPLKDGTKEVIFQSFPLKRNKTIIIIVGIYGVFAVKPLEKEIIV